MIISFSIVKDEIEYSYEASFEKESYGEDADGHRGIQRTTMELEFIESFPLFHPETEEIRKLAEEKAHDEYRNLL
jgi:hypothetical protein